MDNAQFAKRIKETCKIREIPISKMLSDCDIRKGLIYDLEKRDWTPSIVIAEKIALYLECSVDYLIGRTDNPNINGNNISAGNTGIGVGNFNSSINITAKDKKSNEFDSTTMQVAEAFQNLDFDDKFEVMQLLIQKKKNK